jgi:hypothetical protein
MGILPEWGGKREQTAGAGGKNHFPFVIYHFSFSFPLKTSPYLSNQPVLSKRLGKAIKIALRIARRSAQANRRGWLVG